MNAPTTIDYVNLGIAVAGAVLALVAIAWQAATWWLGGARIKVSLREGAVGGGNLVTWPGTAGRMNLGNQGLDQRVLAVEVMNKGRMHAYVVSVGAELENGVRFHPGAVQGNKPLPFRLESGGSETWFVDHAILDAAASVPLNDKLPERRARMLVSTATGKTHRTKYANLD